MLKQMISGITKSAAEHAPSLGKAINYGMTGYFGISAYNDARNEGKGRISAIGSGIMNVVLPEILGGGMYMALDFGSELPGLAVSGAQGLPRMAREQERVVRNQAPFQANTFVDSQQIYTMRQAGMALAEQSKYQLEQTIMGNEAQYLHR